jgi:hypothetical protein
MERRLAFLLWLFTALFAARVAGQAIQRWVPQAFLPPFDAFQGSNLPYWQLLSVQIVILAIMCVIAWRAQRNALAAHRRTGRVLAWAGGIYMAGSLGRIAVGALWRDAPAWFSAWIPAFFHVVLAAFVLTLSLYQAKR